MMWLSVYQSVRCWDVSSPVTEPNQTFTLPQVQMGTRPIIHSVNSVSITTAAANAIFRRPIGLLAGAGLVIAVNYDTGKNFGRMLPQKRFHMALLTST